jgi:acetyl esterase/lipase
VSILDRPGPEPDEVIAYGPHRENLIDMWHGEGAQVVLLHGGFWRPQWDRMHLRTMAGALREAGYRVALPEYRRVPGMPDLMTADVTGALAGLEPSILIGHSAGGHLALWAADKARAVLALAPVADLILAERKDLDVGAVRDFLGGPADSRPDLDPIRLAPAGVPVTLLHGTEDDRVPLEVSQTYAAAHPEAQLVPLPGADHFDLIDPASPVWPVLLEELAML